ncbi:Na+/H+ antiporter subunit A [Sporosarcina sp. NCCP-2222]|uniref:Na+/H+ antiporter subunit A n=1 Tax=Sporosarcina sp. NCCP-2222 TaxID=2935073 RepID=UPI0020BF981A|nr:Na+/H+ antiporter subunit A [Sporosarcina sp. NCCP-2222]
MLIVLLAIFFPFFMAFFVPFLYKRIHSKHIGWFVLLVPILLFILLASFVPSVAGGAHYTYTVQWIDSAGINFTTNLDGLSMIFGLLITGVGSLVILYSIYYLSEREALGRFYVYLLMFMGAMLGVVFSDNVMVLYVFWELTSISSFLLIAFWYHRKQSRYGAKKSMLITVSGGVAMLAGFLMLHTLTGTFSLREIVDEVGNLDKTDPLFYMAMILILLGAFTKSAQFPFHIWLPDAMEAPTPVSAYLHSATMVKAGIYLVARFTPIFGGETVWFYSVTCVGIFTLFWGSFNAVRQTDLKALLAYSTISQLGLIMSLLGIGSMAVSDSNESNVLIFTAATFAGLFHLINHSTFKGALFMVVGIVDHELGTRDIRRLGGLMSFMPLTFTVALIGSFSMAGLPPFNGFLSKEMFFEAVVQLSRLDLVSNGALRILIPVVAWVASVFTFIYSMIIVFKTFLGMPQSERVDKEAHEPPIGMLVAPFVLSFLVIGIFIFPNGIGRYLLTPAMTAVFPMHRDLKGLVPHISAWHGVNPQLLMTVGVIVAGSLLYISLKKWKKVYALGPLRWNLDSIYNFVLTKTESGSNMLTGRYMTGYLRDYFVYIFSFFIAVAVGGLFWIGNLEIDLSKDAAVTVNEYIIIAVMMLAGLSILVAKSRKTAILLNGVLGYSIAILFVVLRAPDLALTQIVVETVTTVLFLLCFYFLPEWKREDTKRSTKLVNGFIAVAVGSIVTILALMVQGNKLFTSISFYFEDAYRLAGGKNIVNTILGDFRAFDTMLEVVVLFIAGIGVFSLIKLKAKKGEKDIGNQ